MVRHSPAEGLHHARVVNNDEFILTHVIEELELACGQLEPLERVSTKLYLALLEGHAHAELAARTLRAMARLCTARGGDGLLFLRGPNAPELDELELVGADAEPRVLMIGSSRELELPELSELFGVRERVSAIAAAHHLMAGVCPQRVARDAILSLAGRCAQALSELGRERVRLDDELARRRVCRLMSEATPALAVREAARRRELLAWSVVRGEALERTFGGLFGRPES